MQRKVWVNVPMVARLSAPIWLRRSLKNLTLGTNRHAPLPCSAVMDDFYGQDVATVHADAFETLAASAAETLLKALSGRDPPGGCSTLVAVPAR
jgi:hypothetical protein